VIDLGSGLLADGGGTHDGRVADGAPRLGAVLLVQWVPGGHADILPGGRWQGLKLSRRDLRIVRDT
jgi:hypothetical protein